MKLLLMTALAAGLLLVADTPKDEGAAKDLKALEGTWKAVSVEQDGQSIGEDRVKEFELTIKGDKYTLKVGGQEEEEGTFKLNPDKKPKEIDITITKGDDKGKMQLGIYDLEGDTFKCCVTPAGSKERPKELSAKAGSNQILFVFKRAKS